MSYRRPTMLSALIGLAMERCAAQLPVQPGQPEESILPRPRKLTKAEKKQAKRAARKAASPPTLEPSNE